jgi:hypothetical protein
MMASVICNCTYIPTVLLIQALCVSLLFINVFFLIFLELPKIRFKLSHPQKQFILETYQLYRRTRFIGQTNENSLSTFTKRWQFNTENCHITNMTTWKLKCPSKRAILYWDQIGKVEGNSLFSPIFDHPHFLPYLNIY